jgi:DNA-binding phage protein
LETGEKFTVWDPVHELKCEHDMAIYFEACIENDPGDGSLIRTALRDITRARSIRKKLGATKPMRK